MFSRHLFGIAALALSGLLSQRALPSSVVVDPASVVRLTPKNMNPATSVEVVLNSVATANDIFATGFTDHDRNLAWAFKVAHDGSVAWTTPYNSGGLERPYIVSSALDGGYWVAGAAYTRDVRKETYGNPHWTDVLRTVEFEYIRHFDRNGKTSDILHISPIGEDHIFSCGLEVPGGYILTGWAGAGEKYKNESSPWIEMIDKTGKRLWEHTFIEQQDRLLGMNLEMGLPNRCSGLHVTANGTITWITRVKTHHVLDTPQGRQAIWMANSNGYWGNFLAQLDAQGKAINLSFVQEIKDPTLIEHGNGFVLFEYPVHQDQHEHPGVRGPVDTLGFRPDVDYRLTAKILDASLQELRSWGFKADTRWSHVETAVQTAEGGWLLGTCEPSSGPSTLMYLNAAGVLSAPVSIDLDKSQLCDRIAITSGSKKGEAIVLAFNERSGARTMIVNYAD